MNGSSHRPWSLVAALACCSIAGVAGAAERFVWFGTYTNEKTKSEGVYVSRFDDATGTLGPPRLAAATRNPSFLALHPRLPVLCAISEERDVDGKPRGTLTTFAVDPATGMLTVKDAEPTGGGVGCHVTFDRDGKVVLAANYGDGTVACLGVDADGGLRPAVAETPGGLVRHAWDRGGEPGIDARRQERAHAHSVDVSPDGRFAFVCDLGLDEVLVHALDRGRATLTPHAAVKLKAGAGPRHFALHPDGRRAWCVNELDLTVTGFAYDPDAGTLAVVETLSTLPPDVTDRKGFSTAEIAVHPTGKFLYASNRGHHSIAMYAIDAATGRLAFLGVEPIRGRTPRNFAIDPTGRFLLAAGQDSNTVSVFAIDADTGRLAFTGTSIEVPSPVCVVFDREPAVAPAAALPGPTVPEWSADFVAEALADARAHGDARRGARVFHASTTACASCHRVGGAGGVVGPELTTVATCLSPEQIVESLYWPGRTVKPEYRATSLTLTDGRSLQGIVRGETPEAITLVDAAGKTHRLAPGDVDERVEVGSLMPQNVFTALPAEERRDLIRYLLELGRTTGLEGLAHKAGPFDLPREPLQPEEWPNREHPVNRHRLYDAYTRQALAFRGREPLPLLLPAWPGLDGGGFGHWGVRPEEAWNDGRRNRTDLGSLQCWPLKVEGRVIPRAVNLRLGDDGSLCACFNPDTLAIEAVWSGGFLRFAEARWGFMAPAEPAGPLVEVSKPGAAPREPFEYHGFYRHGRRVVFAYRLGDTEMLDAPWVQHGKLVREVGPAAGHPLAHVAKGGPPQWPQVLSTTGSVGTAGPYAIDTIRPPFDNPWNALLFFGGLGFFSNGDAALCTMQGDVWRVSGLDADLRDVRWRRIAAGLNQALGLVVADDVVYVLGGDQLTRLDDTNGDGEADFHACVTNRFEPSGGHNFKCGLERDAAGTFFTASHQGLLRISPDGATVEVLAVGFRNPDGIGLLPDGTVTVPVSEGEWTPASAICAVPQQPGRPPASPPPNFKGVPPALPLAYLPRGLDNSCGGQAFVSGDRWGPLDGQLVHFSFGTCTHLLVLRDEVAGRPQGAVVPLPGDFRSGIHRGRFSPADGQLYVCGMTGWQSYAVEDGCFQRVRYTGGAVQQPVAWRAHRNGVRLTFSAPVDAQVAGDPANHFAQCWNYRFGPGYGSPEFSPSHYGTVGHDPLPIRSATVLPDGKSLFLEIPDLQPVNQLHLHVAVGGGETRDVFATVHALDEPFRDIPDYRDVTRPVAAHPILRDVAMMRAAVKNPWLAPIEGARAVTIEAAANLAYTVPELRAKPGEKLALTFVNPDVVPHNWLLVKPGTLAAVGGLADALITDPEAVARHYVPKSDDVIVHADVTEPGQRQTIHFAAPQAPGRYPYLCTFPGHWKLMNGVLIVE